MHICEAIAGRRLMEIWYRGGSRIIEPYCHGTSKAGNEVLRAFQIQGHSNSGQPTAWKLFEVREIQSLQIFDQRFETNRPLYNPNDRDMIRIHCRV
jgi:hypothetical protein